MQSYSIRLAIAILSFSILIPGSPRSLHSVANAQTENDLHQTEPDQSSNQTTPVVPFTVTGQLDSNNQVLESDDTYYSTHLFDGVAGQSVVIEMTSNEFDTYLILQDPNGQQIAQNNNSSGTNSRITITLPITGQYKIVVSAYTRGELGRYVLNLRAASSNDLALAEANRLSQQGIQQLNSRQLHKALESFQQALELYRAC